MREMRSTEKRAPGGREGRRRVSGPSGRSRGVDAGELAARELDSLNAVARRFSLNRDDADEAVQRGLEILLRRADSLDATTAGGWLRTVVKHEAFAVRAERVRSCPVDPEDLERLPDGRSPSEAADLMERLSLAAEAMARIKPLEAEALMLQAEGLTYKDIASKKGWTYTKVNRLVNEGARSFRSHVSEIEAGEVCSEVPKGPDGELRLHHRRHLLRCAACRAEIREARSGIHLPALALPAILMLPLKLLKGAKQAGYSFADRAVGGAVKAQSAIEAASSGKVVALAASAAAMAGGGVVAANSELRHSLPRHTANGRVAAAPSNAASSGRSDVAESRPEAPTAGQGSEFDAATTIDQHEAPAAEFGPGDAASPQPAVSSVRRAPAPSRAKAQPATEFGP